MVAGVEVDGRDARPRRLVQRQAARARGHRRLHAQVVEVRPRGVRHAERGRHRHRARGDVERAGIRVERAAGPVRAAAISGQHQRAEVRTRFAVREHRRRVERADLVPVHDRDGLGVQFRREVEHLVRGDALRLKRRGLGRERLGGRRALAVHVGRRHGTFLDRPDRFAGLAIEHEREALFCDECDGPNRAAVHGEVAQDRRGGRVVVPEAVVDDLVMPDPQAGRRVEAHEALREEVVAQPVAAVEVVRRRFDREVDEPEVEVRAHQRPHARVACVRPRLVLPRVSTVLARLRDRVENPEPLAGAHVIPADVPRRGLLDRRIDRRWHDLHDDDVADDDGWGT